MNGEKPDFLDEEDLNAALEFLDDLRESGVVNMFGARPYLQEWGGDEGWDYTGPQYSSILTYWMATFSARHAQD